MNNNALNNGTPVNTTGITIAIGKESYNTKAKIAFIFAVIPYIILAMCLIIGFTFFKYKKVLF